jgi:hypothetical protein
MQHVRSGLALVAAALIGVVACDDETGPGGSLDLAFELDDSFQGAHGGQDIYLAVVRISDGVVVARETGTVSASADPSYSVTIAGAFEEDTDYEVHYWIDSNFGGGTEGACDPTDNDHQWNRAVSAASDDVTLAETHEPDEVEDVCDTFAADLTFAGDDGFQAAHGGQDVTVAVVRASDGLVVALDDGTVSDTEDPAFAFDFAGVLVIGVSYEIHYWIDSNFGGGTAGECDPPATDHQWLVDVGEVDDDVTVTEMHDPTATTDVCETFNAE